MSHHYTLVARMDPAAAEVLKAASERTGLSLSAVVEALIRLHGPKLRVPPKLRDSIHGRGRNHVTRSR